MPVIEEQKVMPTEEVVPPIGQDGIGQDGKPQSYFVSKRKMDLGENKNNVLLMGGALAAAALIGVLMLSHTDKPGPKPPQQPSRAIAKPTAKGSASFTPGDKASTSTDPTSEPTTSAADIENTKGRSGETQGNPLPSETGSTGQRNLAAGASGYGSQSRGKPGPLNYPGGNRQQLGSVPPFQPPTYQSATSNQPAPYVGTGLSATDQARAYAEEVTKPSMIFAAQVTSSPATNVNAAGIEPITNFGLVPGFHVSAHLEASVSTVGGVPAVAVIEYDCMQNGTVIIPAGSRVIGKIMGASSTGLVNMAFSEIYLPSGTRAPINAVGLDQYLHQIKGNVTGKNTGKQFMLASLTSVGSLGAGFFGNNNSGAITQSTLAREQIASNIGNAGDQAIQRLQVSQSLVVTVPSGTLLYVTFVAPIRGTLQQAAATATSPR
ncbi:TrbI/VirB10 family protein [Edaphobacter modestus]|uniref:Conjugative transfer protein TrbI n=1 Tax=Edaphobacter modestus TaxID=388466 RepID=A0A4Q7XZZ7_9BACT|nr:TrbI/VirB10 family protein [Edaphobacter modestus]RZU29035.1 conjugative transfer protein TrbI [Edaphobacter modestus]